MVEIDKEHYGFQKCPQKNNLVLIILSKSSHLFVYWHTVINPKNVFKHRKYAQEAKLQDFENFVNNFVCQPPC